jgi:pimeloyl-ACP methyl ester carboxylesterase
LALFGRLPLAYVVRVVIQASENLHPTLVLGGEEDPMIPIEAQQDIVAALPAHLVRFERFPNCGHSVTRRCAPSQSFVNLSRSDTGWVVPVPAQLRAADAS